MLVRSIANKEPAYHLVPRLEQIPQTTHSLQPLHRSTVKEEYPIQAHAVDGQQNHIRLRVMASGVQGSSVGKQPPEAVKKE